MLKVLLSNTVDSVVCRVVSSTKATLSVSTPLSTFSVAYYRTNVRYRLMTTVPITYINQDIQALECFTVNFFVQRIVATLQHQYRSYLNSLEFDAYLSNFETLLISSINGLTPRSMKSEIQSQFSLFNTLRNKIIVSLSFWVIGPSKYEARVSTGLKNACSSERFGVLSSMRVFELAN